MTISPRNRPQPPAQPQVFAFRTPRSGEILTRQVIRDLLHQGLRIHAGSIVSEAVTSCLEGKIINDVWVFRIQTLSGSYWVTHSEGSDLTKSDVQWLPVQLPPNV